MIISQSVWFLLLKLTLFLTFIAFIKTRRRLSSVYSVVGRRRTLSVCWKSEKQAQNSEVGISLSLCFWCRRGRGVQHNQPPPPTLPHLHKTEYCESPMVWMVWISHNNTIHTQRFSFRLPPPRLRATLDFEKLTLTPRATVGGAVGACRCLCAACLHTDRRLGGGGGALVGSVWMLHLHDDETPTPPALSPR